TRRRTAVAVHGRAVRRAVRHPFGGGSRVPFQPGLGHVRASRPDHRGHRGTAGVSAPATGPLRARPRRRRSTGVGCVARRQRRRQRHGPCPGLRGDPRVRVRRWLSAALPPLGVFAVVVAAWYAVSMLLLTPDRRFLLPPPDAVIRVGFTDRDNLAE